jgi:polyisoprenyl-phosphate glycosyltransferase
VGNDILVHDSKELLFMRERLEIVVPIYNEEPCLDALLTRLIALRENISDLVDAEFIFVDDGSRDASFKILREAASRNEFIKVIRFRRNFGHQMAITAGMDASTADWVAVIDADLQDPPELLRDMLLTARNGNYEIVYGKRNVRDGETFFKLFTAKVFYRTLNSLCDVDIPSDTGDFRLMRKVVVDTLRLLPERHRFVRGLVPWLGFSSTAFEYHRKARHAGETKYSIYKMMQLAITAILSFSVLPLRIASFIGLFSLTISIGLGVWFFFLKIFTNQLLPGYASIVCIMLFIGGTQISLLGIIGEYLAKMFEESKGRPIYLVGESLNLNNAELTLDGYPRLRGYAHLEMRNNRSEGLRPISEDARAA